VKSLFAICYHVLFLALLTGTSMARRNSVPLVDQPLVPASVRPGSKGFMLTVNGSGFASNAVVKWNGSPRVTFVNSSDQVQADIKASDVAKAGTASVTVVNPKPGGGTSNVLYLPIHNPTKSVAFGRDAKVTPQGGIATTGDFNGDGIVDFAVATSGTLFVYLGKGDGTFRRPIQTTLSSNLMRSISVADVNNDGKLDLLVTNGVNGSNCEVDILLGDGTGRFNLSQTIGFGSGDFPVATAAGDLNGDGKLDFILTDFGDYNSVIIVYLGNGDGTFTQGSVLGDLGSGSFPVLADFNGDGNLDIATAIGTAVAIYLGKGDGTFVDGAVYSTKNFAGAVAAADVNGDGKLDLITDGVDVLLGNGDGTFSQGASIPVSTNGDVPVVVGDFNSDGKLDVGVVPVFCQQTCQENEVTVLLGDGTGNFQSPLQFAISTSGFVAGFSAADFNNDGRLDFVVGGGTSGAEVLLRGTAIVSPTNLDFGTIKVGSHSQPQTAKLTNIGSSALKIDSINIGGDPTDFSETNHCSKSLPPHRRCNIKVTFSPKKAGMLSASLEIQYDGGNVLDVALSGTGLQGLASLTPSQMTFALQLVGTKSTTQTATLTNQGRQTVTISNIQTKGPFGETNNCPSTLTPGTNCQIQVTFQPTQKGDVKGTLEVTDDAQGSPQKVALSGAGTVVKLSAANVNFGDQKVGTKGPAVPIKLTNVGKVALSISQIALTGKDPGDFTEANDCGTSVPPGGSCTIKVGFTPQKKGQRSADVSITDDGGGSPQKVGLFGNGT
jgi:hypothetical protein